MSEAEEKRREQRCGYYLRQRHGLIRRHLEAIELNPDHTAHWSLRIDFELPSDSEACWDRKDGECLFLFPLVYLKKSDARTGFDARDDQGNAVPIPIREECDTISRVAAAQAARSLLGKAGASPGALDPSELEDVLGRIIVSKPLDAAMTLQDVRAQVGLPADPTAKPTAAQQAIGKAWTEAGLVETLHMLVEHSLVWVPLRGRPGERRTVIVSQRISLLRRAFLRWVFADMKEPRPRWRYPLRTRRVAKVRRREAARDAGQPHRKDHPPQTLRMGSKKRYGRLAYRISFSALGERIGQPLAWMPFEFEFPSVYTTRCRSYHFELICPPGRSPRDLRPAWGTLLAEPSGRAKRRPDEDTEGRTVLTSRIARHDRLGTRTSDIWFRVTVGVGDGAFPALWFLTGAITATMLWTLAARQPELAGGQDQIVAGILLVVPALVGALALGGDSVPITRLVGGARMLLLVTGLSAVAATAVVAGARPWDMDTASAWAWCAIAATLATVPLGTSWLLSSPFVWRQQLKLRTNDLQHNALWIGVGLALLAVAVLIGIDGLVSLHDFTPACVAIGAYLLTLTVSLVALANNRAAMPVHESRDYVALSLMLAAIVCLALTCIELRAAIDPDSGPQTGIELIAGGLLLLSLSAGDLLNAVTKWAAPREDEIHVSPHAGRALLAGERAREMIELRGREGELAETGADMSSGGLQAVVRGSQPE